jgi:DNA-binding response OmpR family regulator
VFDVKNKCCIFAATENARGMTYSPSLGNIIVIDDEPNITNLLQVNLGCEGYTVTTVNSAADFASKKNLQEVDLVIVDAMRQDYTGLQLIKDLRNEAGFKRVGIIAYSSEDDDMYPVDALNAGADDYILKPFSLRELVARVKAVIRRYASQVAPEERETTLNFKTLSVDVKTHRVTLDNMPLTLTKTEYQILAMLMRNVNSYISRIEIHRSIWPQELSGANERKVDTNISRLRKKLGNVARNLVNRSGRGYMIADDEHISS